jgi:hypothetical protein
MVQAYEPNENGEVTIIDVTSTFSPSANNGFKQRTSCPSNRFW